MNCTKLRLPPHLLSAVLVILFCGIASAQYGTAPAGYYPDSYGGSIFTGKVQGTASESITLTYAHGVKTDTFEGHAAAPCNLPVSKTETRPMPLSEIPATAVVTVFYETETVKIDGEKHKRHEIIAISFQELNGKAIAKENRVVFSCAPSRLHRFKVF